METCVRVGESGAYHHIYGVHPVDMFSYICLFIRSNIYSTFNLCCVYCLMEHVCSNCARHV